jgi:hypothetical protein
VTSRTVILFFSLLVAFLACGAQKTMTEETKSGRLSFIKTRNIATTLEGHEDGWAVSRQDFYINGRPWSPDRIKVLDIVDCEISPNLTVEAFKCYTFAGGTRETVYILRMNGDKPEWVTASDIEFEFAQVSSNLGEWVGEGHWLLFRDYYFNVEDSRQTPIRRLPEYPGYYFRAASPDLGTIIYEEFCFEKRFDLPPGGTRDEEISKQCKLSKEHAEKGILAFWLIDAASGKVRLLELNKQKYPQFVEVSNARRDSLTVFQKMLVWQKDRAGKDHLVYPN